MTIGDASPNMRINDATGEIYYLGEPIITPKVKPSINELKKWVLSREDGERATRRAALKEVQRLIREFEFTLEEIRGE